MAFQDEENIQAGSKDASTEERFESSNSEPVAGEVTADASRDPLTEWKTRVAYLSAEIENMRKRFLREKTEVVKWGNETLLKSLLPVMDNLELAVQAAKKAETTEEYKKLAQNPLFTGLLKGLEMTLKHFGQTLEQAGVTSIPTVGQPFDPHVHEALGEASDASLKDDAVAQELQSGFTLNGRVLRPARVLVNKLHN